MSEKRQRKTEVKDKVKTNVEPTTDMPDFVTSPPIRVVYGGNTYNFAYGELGLEEDPAMVGDRTLFTALEAKLEEVTEKKVTLRAHNLVRLDNGNWLVTPPATFG